MSYQDTSPRRISTPFCCCAFTHLTALSCRWVFNDIVDDVRQTCVAEERKSVPGRVATIQGDQQLLSHGTLILTSLSFAARFTSLALACRTFVPTNRLKNAPLTSLFPSFSSVSIQFNTSCHFAYPSSHIHPRTEGKKPFSGFSHCTAKRTIRRFRSFSFAHSIIPSFSLYLSLSFPLTVTDATKIASPVKKRRGNTGWNVRATPSVEWRERRQSKRKKKGKKKKRQ